MPLLHGDIVVWAGSIACAITAFCRSRKAIIRVWVNNGSTLPFVPRVEALEFDRKQRSVTTLLRG